MSRGYDGLTGQVYRKLRSSLLPSLWVCGQASPGRPGAAAGSQGQQLERRSGHRAEEGGVENAPAPLRLHDTVSDLDDYQRNVAAA